MITDDEALFIATDHLLQSGGHAVVERVYPGTSLPSRVSIYGLPPTLLAESWVAYVTAPAAWALRASTVVVVDRATGRVLYYGSAGDEG